VHGFFVKAFAKMGDKGPLVFYGPGMLFLDAIPPFKVIGSGFMGKSVFPDCPDGKGREYEAVDGVGEMVVYRGYPGKNAFVAAQGVKLFPGHFGALREGGGSFKVFIPGLPGKVKSAFFGAYRRPVIALKMIVGVYEGGVHKGFFFQIQNDPVSGIARDYLFSGNSKIPGPGLFTGANDNAIFQYIPRHLQTILF